MSKRQSYFSSPEEYSRKLAKKVITLSWHILAAQAYSGYLKYGKGHLLLKGIPPTETLYATQKSDAGEIDYVGYLVENYDPSKEVVIVVDCPNRKYLDFFTFSGLPTPPVAYEQRQKRG